MGMSVDAALAFLLGYLLGSVPFGLLLTRAAGLGDVRAIGSGNIGATNVLRTGHKGLAAATLLLDALKGTAAVLIAGKLGGLYAGIAILAGLVAGLGAFLGHLFPVWLRFKGGRGVATYIGVLLALAWPLGLLFCGLWLIVAILTRYSSLSALTASALLPLASWGYGRPEVALLLTVMGGLLFVRHRDNIRRLIAGTESRIGA